MWRLSLLGIGPRTDVTLADDVVMELAHIERDDSSGLFSFRVRLAEMSVAIQVDHGGRMA
jgi:hypothetical protein